jgi:hypothetical protein
VEAIASISASLEDIKIGFVYADYKDNKLIIDGRNNFLNINNQQVIDNYTIKNSQTYLSWVIFILIFVGLLIIFWKEK